MGVVDTFGPNPFTHGQGTHSAKIVLIIRPKIPQMPQNLSDQFVCPSPKIWDFIEERLHWASVVRGLDYWIGSRIFNIDNEFPALFVLPVQNKYICV